MRQDREEPLDFECPECGEEPSADDVCENEECPAFGEEPLLAMSDWQERQEERRRMGIGA